MTIGSETYKIFRDECLVVPAGQVYAFASLDINKGYLCHFQNDMISSRFGKQRIDQGYGIPAGVE